MTNPVHPGWSILRLVIVNASILTALATITESWDGEVGVVCAALGSTFVTELLTNRLSK